MRTLLITIAVAMPVLLLDGATTTASARCQTVGCFQECYWVGPGHRRCRERCHVRCWDDAPRYYAPDPQPQYYAPAHNGDPTGPLVLLLIIAGIIAAIAGASTDTTSTEIAEIEQSTFDAYAEAEDAEDEARSITSYIADEEADAYERGRRAADREWKDYTRHE